MNINVRLANEDDAERITELLQTSGSQYGWTIEKYNYYYRDYPDGKTIASVALNEKGEALGFYGALPVRAGAYSAVAGAHAIVSPAHRGRHLWGPVLEVLCEEARKSGAQFLMGYANPRFTKGIVKNYGYILAGYAHFVDADDIDFGAYRDRFRFEYSDAWYQWKFGFLADYYSKEYVRNADGGTSRCLQLHTSRIDKVVAPQGRRLNLWHPAAYSADDPGEWSQGIAIKPLVDGLDPDIFKIDHWRFDMADNDSIEYRQWT